MVINQKTLRIKNAIFSGYCFQINTKIQGNFQVCISKSAYVFFLCRKAEKKILLVLVRLSFCTSLKQERFSESQSGYYIFCFILLYYIIYYTGHIYYLFYKISLQILHKNCNDSSEKLRKFFRMKQNLSNSLLRNNFRVRY